MVVDFQFSTFDSRRWGYIRGRSILYSLLQSKELTGDYGVDAVQIVSGHVAIRYQQSRSLVLFDAVVANKQMSELQVSNTEPVLNSKTLLPPPPTNQHSEQFPLFACSFSSPIVKFHFEKSVPTATSTNISTQPQAKTKTVENTPLRLFVFEEDAVLHVFEWSAVEYRWTYNAKVYLPSVSLTEASGTPLLPPAGHGQLVHASIFSTSQGVQVIWMMANSSSLQMRQFKFDSKTAVLSANKSNIVIKQYNKLEEILCNNLKISPTESYEIKKEWFDAITSSGQQNTRILTSKLGIWFVTKSFILLYSIRSRIWFISYFKDRATTSASSASISTAKQFAQTHCDTHDLTSSNGDSLNHQQTQPQQAQQSNSFSRNQMIVDVMDVCIHPQTQELIVLEKSGRVFTCDAGDRETLRLTLLAVLDPWTADGAPATARVTIHQNALVVIKGRETSFFDLKCGKLLTTLQAPVDLSKLSLKSGGIWEQTPIGIVWGTGVWARQAGLWEIKAGPPLHLIENHLVHHKVVQQQQTQQQQQSAASIHSIGGLINTNKNQSVGCAPTTCRQWDMKRLEAKYLLDMALSEQDEEMKIQICRALIPKLENPSLVIVLLSSMQSESSSKFIQEELANFLETYNYLPPLGKGDGEGDTEEDIQARQRQSLYLHTPLNRIMVPLLTDYYNLQRSIKDEQPVSAAVALASSNSVQIPFIGEDDQSLAAIDDQKLLGFSNEFLELFKRKNPLLLLNKFEQLLGLDRVDFEKYADINGEMVPFPAINEVLLQQEEILKKKSVNKHHSHNHNHGHGHGHGHGHNHGGLLDDSVQSNLITYPVYPLFETLCQLYYKEKPERLIPFIRIVFNAATTKMLEQQANSTFTLSALTATEVTKFIPQNDHFTRALISLPTLIPTDDAKIDAKFKLLCAIGHRSNALRWLLTAGKWEKAIQMVKNSTYNDKEHYVLFEILFCHCVEKKDSVKLKQCWTVIPKNYSVFNLFSILKPNQTADQKSNNTSASGSGFFGELGSSVGPLNKETTNQTRIVSVSPSEDLTIDMFRAQLLKLLN